MVGSAKRRWKKTEVERVNGVDSMQQWLQVGKVQSFLDIIWCSKGPGWNFSKMTLKVLVISKWRVNRWRLFWRNSCSQGRYQDRTWGWFWLVLHYRHLELVHNSLPTYHGWISIKYHVFVVMITKNYQSVRLRIARKMQNDTLLAFSNWKVACYSYYFIIQRELCPLQW